MADEADPGKHWLLKMPAPGRLIALVHVPTKRQFGSAGTGRMMRFQLLPRIPGPIGGCIAGGVSGTEF